MMHGVCIIIRYIMLYSASNSHGDFVPVAVHLFRNKCDSCYVFSRIVALSAPRRHTLLRPYTVGSQQGMTARCGPTPYPTRRFTSTLVIPCARRTTLGDRAFPVTAARAWNALPSSVRSAPSLLQFRRDLKTALFQSSYSSPWCPAV